MGNKRKLFSKHMLLFEFRKVIGNPYVHIFGVGMPILMMVIITRAVVGEMVDQTRRKNIHLSGDRGDDSHGNDFYGIRGEPGAGAGKGDTAADGIVRHQDQ